MEKEIAQGSSAHQSIGGGRIRTSSTYALKEVARSKYSQSSRHVCPPPLASLKIGSGAISAEARGFRVRNQNDRSGGETTTTTMASATTQPPSPRQCSRASKLGSLLEQRWPVLPRLPLSSQFRELLTPPPISASVEFPYPALQPKSAYGVHGFSIFDLMLFKLMFYSFNL